MFYFLVDANKIPYISPKRIEILAENTSESVQAFCRLTINTLRPWEKILRLKGEDLQQILDKERYNLLLTDILLINDLTKYQINMELAEAAKKSNIKAKVDADNLYLICLVNEFTSNTSIDKIVLKTNKIPIFVPLKPEYDRFIVISDLFEMDGYEWAYLYISQLISENHNKRHFERLYQDLKKNLLKIQKIQNSTRSVYDFIVFEKSEAARFLAAYFAMGTLELLIAGKHEKAKLMFDILANSYCPAVNSYYLPEHEYVKQALDILKNKGVYSSIARAFQGKNKILLLPWLDLEELNLAKFNFGYILSFAHFYTGKYQLFPIIKELGIAWLYFSYKIKYWNLKQVVPKGYLEACGLGNKAGSWFGWDFAHWVLGYQGIEIPEANKLARPKPKGPELDKWFNNNFIINK